MLRHLLLLGTILGGTTAQTLLEALSRIPELSNFTSFYRANQFVTAYFENSSSYPITFLAPSNNALREYSERNQVSLFDVGPQTLLQLVQYHTLVSDLSRDNFTSSGTKGLTTPTLLQNSPNNNRSSGAALAAKFGGPERASGQVVFIQSAGQASAPNRFKLMSRQSSGPQNAGVRSGLASTVDLQTLDAVQGTWDGGRFHIIDGLLTLPTTCARTIRSVGLTSFDNALNRTSLWPTLDRTKNLTCLGPDNNAFRSIGNPDSTLNSTALRGALLYHTLPEVAYSDFLYDGQEFKSLQNGTVRVRVEERDGSRTIWFNNAKVINANVLTHNGLMHVLDAVMVPLEQLNTTASGTPSLSPSSTATNTASTNVATTNAAVPLTKSMRVDLVIWTFGASLLAMV